MKYRTDDSNSKVAAGSKGRLNRLVKGIFPYGFEFWPDGRNKHSLVSMVRVPPMVISSHVPQVVENRILLDQQQEEQPEYEYMPAPPPPPTSNLVRIPPGHTAEVASACSVTVQHFQAHEEFLESWLRAVPVPQCILSQGISAWQSSSAYDKVVDDLIERIIPFEAAIDSFVNSLSKQVSRRRKETKTSHLVCYGFPAHRCP